MLNHHHLLLSTLCYTLLSAAPTTITPTTVSRRTVDTTRIEWRLPFLRHVDDVDRQEFFAIIHDHNRTKSEIWSSVDEWAGRQNENVQAQVYEFHQKLAQHVDNSKFRVNRIIQTLPNALRRLSGIVENLRITRSQEKKEIAKLYASLEPDLSKTLQYIIQLVSYDTNEGRDVERVQKLRELKKGGIWTGGATKSTNIL